MLAFLILHSAVTPLLFPVSDNPVLRREALRFSRQWIGWLLVLGAAWWCLTWLLKRWLPTQYFGMQPWQMIVFDTMQMVLRADVPIGFFIAWRCAADVHWHGMRDDLALRFVAPREILFGKVAMPVVAVALMNVFGAYLNYHEVLTDPSFDVTIPLPWMAETPLPAAPPQPLLNAEDYSASFGDAEDAGDVETVAISPFVPPAPPAPRGIVVSAGWPVAAFGLLEDFLYSATMVLIAMSQFLFRRDPFAAAAQALWRVALVGVFIALAGWFWLLLEVAMPRTIFMISRAGMAVEFLASNAVWFALVLPFEIGVLLLFWKRTLRLTERWLREEAPLPSA